VQARRVRPESGPIDRRRLAAAGLSAVLPGLGQAFNRRSRLATLFLVPTLLILGLGLLMFSTQSLTRLAAFVVAPPVLGTLLTINLLLLAWRLLAVGQAFLDTGRHGPTGRLGVVGIAVITILVGIPHVLAYQYGSAFGDAFAQMFEDEEAGAGADPGPPLDERINVLLIGLDVTRLRTATLTDTMMVVSIDPVGHTVTMLSVPRDLIDVPLGNGDNYGPKLNSLMSYADDHPEAFPNGGVAALQRAIGALVGIDIHYYAELKFGSFIRMVDAVGGVDIEVTQGFDDPTYDNYGLEGRGWSITPGLHHFDGRNALAYSRARKGAGESDFTRALRQQQVIIALRDAVTGDGSLLWELPDLLDAVGDAVRTDLPASRLPQLAAVIDEIDDDAITRSIIRHPLVRSVDSRYGSSLQPDLAAIREVADGLFPDPGVEPKPWPTPEPTPKPTATPKP
jgi:polyisoprenyl-teichoic acid--peptidoglycan teichoic acid transferase